MRDNTPQENWICFLLALAIHGAAAAALWAMATL